MLTMRQNLKISDLVRGNEATILQALGITWPPAGATHITCPFPDHDDANPSWRWNAQSKRWFCSCFHNGRQSGDVVDAVQRVLGLGFDASAKWIRTVLNKPLGEDPAQFAEPGELVRQAGQEAAERAKRAAAADEIARRANWLYSRAPESDLAFPYLMRKRITTPHAARFVRHGIDRGEDHLLIPLMDAEGRIRNLQRIWAQPGRQKKFMTGSTGATGLRLVIGRGVRSDKLLVCEGWADACALWDATGLPVACAFTAQNLPATVRAMRDRCKAEIILCADEDEAGRHWAEAVAASIYRCRTVYPDFGPFKTDRQKDFSDLFCDLGADEVRRRLGVSAPLLSAGPLLGPDEQNAAA